MAVVSRIATIVQSNGGGSRTWVATAATQDTAAGGSVVVTVTMTSSGATPPSDAETLTLRYVDDAGNIIKSAALSVGTASQTNTFFFTNTGNTGGAARCGTIEIKLQVTRTSIPTYDVETDGSPNTPQTTFTTSQLDRGYIRGTTTLVENVSNVALGGAKTEPAEYDESLYFRATVGAVSYVARALTVASSSGSLSSATASTTAQDHDVTFANVVDDRFPAAVTAVGWTVTVPNATLTSLPDYTFSSTTDASINVDPRLTVLGAGGASGWHFQINQASFDTNYYESSKQMLVSDVGQAAARFVTARTLAGVNGLSVTLTADPTNPGTTVSLSTSTATRDSEAGWTELIDICPNGKPGGTWTLSADITAPADIDADTMIVNPTDTVTVLAQNPNLTPLAGGGNSAASKAGSHFVAGNALAVIAALRNAINRQYATVDSSPAPAVTIMRVNTALARGEFLDVDMTWKAANGVTAYAWTMAQSPGDSGIWLKTFTALETATWANYDLVVKAVLYSSGTPYIAIGEIDVVDEFSPHDVESSSGGGGGVYIGPSDLDSYPGQKREEQRKRLTALQTKIRELTAEATQRLEQLKQDTRAQVQAGTAINWQQVLTDFEAVTTLSKLKLAAEEEEIIAILMGA